MREIVHTTADYMTWTNLGIFAIARTGPQEQSLVGALERFLEARDFVHQPRNRQSLSSFIATTLYEHNASLRIHDFQLLSLSFEQVPCACPA